jgi:hypothetical protein
MVAKWLLSVGISEGTAFVIPSNKSLRGITNGKERFI